MKRIILVFFIILFSKSILFANEKIRFTSNLLLRYERQEFPQTPTPREAVDRYRLRWRPGLLFLVHPDVELGIEAEGNLIHESDEDVAPPRFPEFHTPVFDRDNFKRDEIVLSRAYFEYSPSVNFEVAAGKFENPFLVTEMIWDNDLHPNGAALKAAYVSEQENLRLTVRFADYYASHYHHDRTNIVALQGILQASAGITSTTFSAAYYNYDVDEVPVFLLRTNSRSESLPLNDYNLIDLIGRIRLNWRFPLTAQVDFVHNTAAENFAVPSGGGSDGIHAEIVFGQLIDPRDFRMIYGYHRVESDAVLAAYTTDDWWFPTRVQGHRIRASLMVIQPLTFHASFLRQTLIGQDQDFDRWQFSAEINWP